MEEKTKRRKEMENNIEKLIALVHKLSEKSVEEAIAAVEKIIEENEETEEEKPKCPECASDEVSKNGNKEGKQRYICRLCGKSYGKTTGTVMYNSHCGEAVWNTVISDTVSGVSIEELSKSDSTILSGVC
jgi:transposase-like protein